MKIKQFGILFGDNDFYNTFIPILEYIGKSVTEDVYFTPDQLVEIINSLSFGTYLLFQNKYRYTNELKFTKAYLLIDKSKLLINEDLDRYMESGSHNSECFYLIFDDDWKDVFTVGAI